MLFLVFDQCQSCISYEKEKGSLKRLPFFISDQMKIKTIANSNLHSRG